jgi:peptidoglycan/xylan/chitin deacetylase (PgdA/CDA1 family)
MVSRRVAVLAAAGMTVLAALPDPGGESGGSVSPAGARRAADSAVPVGYAPGTGSPPAASHRVTASAPVRASAGDHAQLTAARLPLSPRAAHRGVERSVPAAGRDLVLTIDDGPNPPYTAEILAVLRRYRVQATFCMVGRNVAEFPDVAKAVVAEGHQLANHTWTHAWLPHLSHAAMVREIERTQVELERMSHLTPTVFRAPFGAWSTSLLDYCWSHRLRALGWSIDPRDWARPPATSIVANVLANARPGRVILDHDGGGDRSHTVAAMRTYLPRLLDRGYRFVLP